MKHYWSEPERLENYKCALRQPGIYIIGAPKDAAVAVIGSGEESSYLLSNWPANFSPYYVGISESKKGGVKSRISAHARGKGSKVIAQRINNSEELYYICIYGEKIDGLEAAFLTLKTSCQFSDNIRPENSRYFSRLARRTRLSMKREELDYYDNLDFDGREL